MWCANCKQEVPAVAAKPKDSDVVGGNFEGSNIVCARCGMPASVQRSVTGNHRIDTAHTTTAAQPTDFQNESEAETKQYETELGFDGSLENEFWDDHELMQAKIAVNSYRMTELNENSIVQRTPIETRLENPNEIRRRDSANQPRNTSEFRQPPQGSRGRGPFRRILPWATMCLGMLLFAFGGAVVSWSVLFGRRELFEVGLPPCLIGQGLLMLGLVFQLERLWRIHRQTLRHLTQLQNSTGQLSRESSLRDQINSRN